jgi:hypothetical protein
MSSSIYDSYFSVEGNLSVCPLFIRVHPLPASVLFIVDFFQIKYPFFSICCSDYNIYIYKKSFTNPLANNPRGHRYFTIKFMTFNRFQPQGNLYIYVA